MLFLEISGWFVDELLLDFRLVVERGSGVGRDFILVVILCFASVCVSLSWRMASKDMLGLGLCLVSVVVLGHW